MGRIELRDPQSFFDSMLKGKSLREFSKEININYSTLKKWRRGCNLIPESQFHKLLRYLKDKSYWLNSVSLKREGWGQAKGGQIAISKLSKKELAKRLEKARSKIQRKPKKIRLVLNKNLCEFYGILMGDGCLSEFKENERIVRKRIIISGHKYLDKQYHENYIQNLIKDEFNLNSYIYCSKRHNIRSLIITSRPFFEILVKLGFPIGKKGQRLKIPDKLLKLSWELKKYIIRGIFDTDGCIIARKDENYRYPCIIITSHSKPLINQLYKLQRNKGYPFWIVKNKSEIRMRGIKNVIKWMDDIGSSNKRHRFKYQYWRKNKILPKKIHGPVD